MCCGPPATKECRGPVREDRPFCYPQGRRTWHPLDGSLGSVGVDNPSGRVATPASRPPVVVPASMYCPLDALDIRGIARWGASIRGRYRHVRGVAGPCRSTSSSAGGWWVHSDRGDVVTGQFRSSEDDSLACHPRSGGQPGTIDAERLARFPTIVRPTECRSTAFRKNSTWSIDAEKVIVSVSDEMKSGLFQNAPGGHVVMFSVSDDTEHLG